MSGCVNWICISTFVVRPAFSRREQSNRSTAIDLGSYHFFQNALEGEKKLDLNQTGMSVTPQDVVEEKPFFNLGTPMFRNGNGNVIDTSA